MPLVGDILYRLGSYSDQSYWRPWMGLGISYLIMASIVKDERSMLYVLFQRSMYMYKTKCSFKACTAVRAYMQLRRYVYVRAKC